MILIVSDLHLGKKPDSDADSLRELEACIRACAASTVVFLGDVFDAFIESGHRPPDVVRQWGDMAARLRRDGVRILYLMGNHDRWHRRYVRDVTGAPPIRGATSIEWENHTIHLEHGDHGLPHDFATSFARWLSDHPFVYRAYTSILPFGAAQRLAATVSRRFASFEPDPSAAMALRNHAIKTLETGGADGVIMGHCHQPDLIDLSDAAARKAWYANSGDWYERRSFVLLAGDDQEPARVQLATWREGKIQIEDAMPVIGMP